LLMNHFLQRYCQRHQRDIPGFSSRLINTLLTHDFPGNIRELQNLVERGVISCDDGQAMDLQHITLNGELFDEDAPLGLTAEEKLGTTAAPMAIAGASEGAAALPHPPIERLIAFLNGSDERLRTSLGEVEGLVIDQALKRTGGNVTAAAHLIGLSRAQINYRLKGK